VTAFRLLLGIGKPADALRRIGATLGIVVALVLIPGVLANAWSGLPLWQRIALAAIGIGAWQLFRPRWKVRNKITNKFSD